MAHDDLDVIVYKVLAYILACAKADVRPSAAKAKEAAKANDTLWAMAVQSMLDEGLVTGVEVTYYYHELGKPTVSESPAIGITLKGQQYLRDNSKMREIAAFLGQAFADMLPHLVSATQAL